MATSNFKSLMQNTRSRTLIIVGGAVTVIMIGIMVSMLSKKDPLQAQPSQTTSIPKNIDITPGGELPERYRNLQVEENTKRAEAASKTGTSAIPTLVGEVKQYDFNLPEFKNPSVTQSLKDITKGQPKPDQKSLEKNLNPKQDDLISQKQKERDAQIRAQQLQKEDSKLLEKRVSEMQGHLKSIFQVWNTYPEPVYVAGKLSDQDPEIAYDFSSDKKDANANLSNQFFDEKGNKIPGKTFKAGTVVFAVLETAINTDEPGPILATIVQGSLKGAKLVGTIEHPTKAEKVILKFNTLSLPNVESSVKIEAVAIDPDTARTALASDVDNHYLLRYGTLFASSFLEGYGEAVGNAGTVVRSPDGSSSTTNPDLSGSEQIYSALGTLGKRWGDKLGDTFNRPPTVFVNQGTGFGLLFTNDVAIPIKAND